MLKYIPLYILWVYYVDLFDQEANVLLLHLPAETTRAF